MVISGNTENAKRVRNADFISAGDGVAGLITDFKEEVGEKGVVYTFSGVELKGLAAKRIILPPSDSAYLTYRNKSPEYVMGNLIASQLINSSDDRKFNGSIAAFTEGSDVITFNGRFDALAQVLANLAETYAIGWYADIQDNNIVWHIFHGVNRSINQNDNNRFILSYDMDTLQQSNLQITKTIPNVAVVAGQGEGIERSMAYVGSASGLNRGEVYIDARDVAEAADLPQRGTEKLAEYGDDTVFEITLSPIVINQYRTNFDLGDIGTIKTNAFSADCILSEITEIYEKGAALRIDTVFGYDKQTISSAIKRLNTNSDTLVKVEGSTSGGGGTTDYTALDNKPQINGVELSGNKTSSQLKLANASHTHDSRYYTETETNTLLAAKANTNHTQAASTITGLSTVATSGSYNDLSNKPTIPPAYTLPTASTTTLGGVKVDGSTITINNGVISASSSGGSYLPLTGGTITGDLRLKDGSNYGRTLYFGDGSYCYISEPTDDRMLIKATSITTQTPNLYLRGNNVYFGTDNARLKYGTWTPTISGTDTYTVRKGWYQKVGNVVTVGWNIAGTFSSYTSNTTMVSITGLPFTSSANLASGGGIVYNCYIPANTFFMGWIIPASSSTIEPRTGTQKTTAGGCVLGTSLFNNPSQFYNISGTITYICTSVTA